MNPLGYQVSKEFFTLSVREGKGLIIFRPREGRLPHHSDKPHCQGGGKKPKARGILQEVLCVLQGLLPAFSALTPLRDASDPILTVSALLSFALPLIAPLKTKPRTLS